VQAAMKICFNQQMALPANGFIYLKGFGNCNNFIYWRVDTARNDLLGYGTTSSMMINRFDTAEFSIEY
jgi:hypothetical protein